MYIVRQGQLDDVVPFLMVDSTDHITGKSGLSPSVELASPGGLFAPAQGVVEEIGHGWYRLRFVASEIANPGILLLHAEAPGADPVDCQIQVVAYDPYDKRYLGVTNIAAIRAGGVLIDEVDKQDIVSLLLSREIDGGVNLHRTLRALLAVLAGYSAGGGTSSYEFRDPTGSQVRVRGKVDRNGNRTEIIIN